MMAREHQFNSPEQVENYLRMAVTVVETVNPPDDLRAVAFAKALDLVSAKQVFFEQPTAIPDGILRGH